MSDPKLQILPGAPSLVDLLLPSVRPDVSGADGAPARILSITEHRDRARRLPSPPAASAPSTKTPAASTLSQVDARTLAALIVAAAATLPAPRREGDAWRSIDFYSALALREALATPAMEARALWRAIDGSQLVLRLASRMAATPAEDALPELFAIGRTAPRLKHLQLGRFTMIRLAVDSARFLRRMLPLDPLSRHPLLERLANAEWLAAAKQEETPPLRPSLYDLPDFMPRASAGKEVVIRRSGLARAEPIAAMAAD